MGSKVTWGYCEEVWKEEEKATLFILCGPHVLCQHRPVIKQASINVCWITTDGDTYREQWSRLGAGCWRCHPGTLCVHLPAFGTHPWHCDGHWPTSNQCLPCSPLLPGTWGSQSQIAGIPEQSGEDIIMVRLSITYCCSHCLLWGSHRAEIWLWKLGYKWWGCGPREHLLSKTIYYLFHLSWSTSSLWHTGIFTFVSRWGNWNSKRLELPGLQAVENASRSRPAELLACVLATKLHSLSSRSKQWVHFIHTLQSVKRTYELEPLSANSLWRYFGPESKSGLKSHFTLSAGLRCSWARPELLSDTFSKWSVLPFVFFNLGQICSLLLG